MDLNKIRKMTDQERTAELERMKQELFNVRFQHVTGQLENPVRMREVRRDIARVKTIMREIEQGRNAEERRSLTNGKKQKKDESRNRYKR